MKIRSHPCLRPDYTPPRRRELFEGTSKILYEGPEPDTHVLFFKDDFVSEGGTTTISGKGILNNRISELLMSRVTDLGIETHFIRALNMREQLVRATDVLPFKVTIHNVASGLFSQRLGLEDGTSLPKPVPEFSLRSKELNHPVVATEHLTALGWGRFEEIDDMLLMCLRINDFLNGQCLALDMRLISFSLEFGRLYSSDMTETQLILTDELSPDTINLLDLTTGQRLDRHGVEANPAQGPAIYQEVARRFGVLGFEAIENGPCVISPEFLSKTQSSPKKSIRKRKNPYGHNSL